MLFRPLFIFVMMSLFISACSIAAEKNFVHQTNEEHLNFPEDIKSLLKQEMLAVEKGMQELVSTIAVGDWQKTAKIGKQIQASYIMKQSLTTEQMKYLHHSLPGQFIKLDHRFHDFAGMLAHAAEVKNADVVNFYFYKMSDSCVQCHSRYAKERFSGFSDVIEGHRSH